MVSSLPPIGGPHSIYSHSPNNDDDLPTFTKEAGHFADDLENARDSYFGINGNPQSQTDALNYLKDAMNLLDKMTTAFPRDYQNNPTSVTQAVVDKYGADTATNISGALYDSGGVKDEFSQFNTLITNNPCPPSDVVSQQIQHNYAQGHQWAVNVQRLSEGLGPM